MDNINVSDGSQPRLMSKLETGKAAGFRPLDAVVQGLAAWSSCLRKQQILLRVGLGSESFLKLLQRDGVAAFEKLTHLLRLVIISET